MEKLNNVLLFITVQLSHIIVNSRNKEEVARQLLFTQGKYAPWIKSGIPPWGKFRVGKKNF